MVVNSGIALTPCSDPRGLFENVGIGLLEDVNSIGTVSYLYFEDKIRTQDHETVLIPKK